MKFKSLLIFLVVLLVTFPTLSKGNCRKEAPKNNGGCTMSVYAFHRTVEIGDSTYIYISFAGSNVSWLPASSITSPNASSTYAHPKTTTTYTVTATTTCGTLTDTITIFVGCTVGVGITSTPYYCSSAAGSAKVTAYDGVAPYTFSWSNGQTSDSISGLIPGAYSVTVNDANGCATTSGFSIASTPISINIYAFPRIIEPGQNTNLQINTNDSLNAFSYSVAWSPSASVTNPNSIGTNAHPTTTTTYTATINTSCGIYTDTVTVFVGCIAGINMVTYPYYCSSAAGQAIAYTSGVPPFTYTWSNGQTTSALTGLNAGSYTLTVMDSNGCNAIDTFSIKSSTILIGAYATPVTIEPSQISNLQAYVSDSIYSSSTSIVWSPSSSVLNPNSFNTSANPSVTTTYTATITTPCGVITDTVTVYIGCAFKAVTSITQFYCTADSGTATTYIVYPYPGLPPYTYLWSNGQTTASITGLNVGNYSVTVKDSIGCTIKDTFSIYNSTLSFTANAYPNIIVSGGYTYLMSFVNGDSAYSYPVSWSPSSSVTNPNSWGTNAYPTATTTYTVAITTPCGIITDTVTVFVSCSNNYDQFICIVTTDTSIDKNVIVWGRNNSPPNGSFNIYDSTASGWTLIGTVPDTALSEYIDTASNPNSRPYSYRISTVDSCGESTLSPFNSTIYLQVVQLSGKDSLYWTEYVGIATPVYRIYRGPSLNALTLIDSVSGSSLSYLDNAPPAGSIYLVEAVNPSSSCVPTHRFISKSHGSNINTSVSLSNGGVPHKPVGLVDIVSLVNSMLISPNPANGLVAVSYSLLKDENVSISIIDEFGRTVYDKQLSNQHAGTSKQAIDIGNIAEGIYSLRIIANDGIMVKKLIVLKNK